MRLCSPSLCGTARNTELRTGPPAAHTSCRQMTYACDARTHRRDACCRRRSLAPTRSASGSVGRRVAGGRRCRQCYVCHVKRKVTRSHQASALPELATTQAELATTQAELITTQAELATTQAELATTQAELATTQAELATTQAELATTQLHDSRRPVQDVQDRCRTAVSRRWKKTFFHHFILRFMSA